MGDCVIYGVKEKINTLRQERGSRKYKDKMKEEFVFKKDGEKCKMVIKETSKGVKIRTEGKGCKKIMGKEYFKEVEMDFPE